MRSEAEAVSRLSLKYPNVTGAIHDDTLSSLEGDPGAREGYGEIHSALKRHNPDLRLWSVVYASQLAPDKWRGLEPYVDVVNLWGGDEDLDAAVGRCPELFPGRPICIGCYLRNYRTRTPVPIAELQDRFERIVRYLEQGKIAGYAILGTVLIDGHQDQAEWVRDFIARHS